MKIKFLCPRWGAESLPFEDFFQKVIDAGFDGVEVSLPEDSGQKDEMLGYLKEFDLPFVLQHWETVGFDFENHKKEYRRRLEYLTEVQPLFVNSQTGKD